MGIVSLNVKRKIRKMKTIATQPATEKTPVISAFLTFRPRGFDVVGGLVSGK